SKPSKLREGSPYLGLMPAHRLEPAPLFNAIYLVEISTCLFLQHLLFRAENERHENPSQAKRVLGDDIALNLVRSAVDRSLAPIEIERGDIGCRVQIRASRPGIRGSQPERVGAGCLE